MKEAEQDQLLNGVMRILRVADRSASSTNDANQLLDSAAKSPTSVGQNFLKTKIGNRVVGDVLSKAIFGIGMFFVAIFTGGVAAFLPDRDGKVMFAGFAVVCLLVAAYHIDLTTRWIRTSTKNPGGEEDTGLNL